MKKSMKNRLHLLKVQLLLKLKKKLMNLTRKMITVNIWQQMMMTMFLWKI